LVPQTGQNCVFHQRPLSDKADAVVAHYFVDTVPSPPDVSDGLGMGKSMAHLYALDPVPVTLVILDDNELHGKTVDLDRAFLDRLELAGHFV